MLQSKVKKHFHSSVVCAETRKDLKLCIPQSGSSPPRPQAEARQLLEYFMVQGKRRQAGQSWIQSEAVYSNNYIRADRVPPSVEMAGLAAVSASSEQEVPA